MRGPSRNRIGWWLFVLALAGATLFVAHAFVGILVLGLFGYYATRPICDRLDRHIESDRLTASLTVLVVLLPVLLLFIYAGVEVVHQVQQAFGGTALSALATSIAGIDFLPIEQRAKLLSMLRNPLSSGGALEGSIWSNVDTGLKVLQAVLGTIILLALSVTLSYALLERDDSIADGLVELFGGRDTTAYAYARTVDQDLESIFFGNLLFVVVMAVIATVAYAATNLVAPSELHVPMVLVLGFLTGVTSIVPIVVGKLVYLPVVALLGMQAMRAGGNHLPFVGGVLVAYVVLLDLLPQSFVQPYVSGRKFDVLLLLFAYILGPILFGWYGFFLLPIVVVLVFEAIRIVLPELVHGEPVRPAPLIGEGAGVDPRDLLDDDRTADGTDPDSDGSTTDPS